MDPRFYDQFQQMLEDQQRQNRVTQEALLRFLQNTPPNDSLLGAPRNRTDTEFRIEALSSSITEFSYDPETNSTFENWYRRYTDLFEQDARNLDDQAKVRLLLRKLDTSAHFKYTNYILPTLPSQFTFAETILKLKKIFDRRQSLFSLRYKCFQLSKQDDMSNLSYMGIINKSCEDIEFNLLSIDQLKCLLYVAGMKSSSDMELRTKLISKLESEHSSITLERLSDEYERLVNIKKDSTMIQRSKDFETSILVNQVSKKKFYKKPFTHKSNQNLASPECSYCGNSHEPNKCPARSAICNYCSRKGHWFNVCLKKKSDDLKASGSNSNINSSQSKKHLIKTNGDANSNHTRVSNIQINKISTSAKRKYVDVIINDKPIKLQVDCGADVSVISISKCKELNFIYKRTSLRPNNASGSPLELLGEFNGNITFNNKTIQSTIYVSKNDDLNVFGLDLLDDFDLWKVPFNDFCSVNQIHSINVSDDYIKHLKSHFNSCFEKSLGHCTNFKAHLNLKEGARLPFIKFRPPPFATQPAIEQELKRLVDIGVISPVTTADCATPIVVKSKKPSGIRICADFSTGLNDMIEDHNYPLPLAEDLFAKLNGAKFFSHIDLSDAFLQIEMDESSKNLLAVHIRSY